jgi:hypothetical protein
MAFLRVSLVELLCQATMGWIPALEYTLSGACRLPRPHRIVPGAMCRRFLRPGAGKAYPLSKAPGRVDWMPRPCTGTRREMRWVDQW